MAIDYSQRPDRCSKCGRDPGLGKGGRSLLVAHHDDYSKPDDVRWLCRLCHAFWHAANTAKNRPERPYVDQGRALRLWRREEVDMTQVELGERIGATHQHLSLIENGHSRPGRSLALLIEDLGGPDVTTWGHRREPVPA